MGELDDEPRVKLALLLPRAAGRARTFYSGGDLYDLQLAAALERRGHTVDVQRTTGTPDARRLLARGYGAVLEDELGHAAYLALNRQLRGRVPAIALVHVTRARLEPQARSAAAERAFLRSCDAAVFVSRQVRRETQRLLDVRVRSVVAPPGCDHFPAAPPRMAAAPRTLRFISVAHLLPNKGQLALIEALADVTEPCRLALAGDPTRDRTYAARVRHAAARDARVTLLGALEPRALARALRQADVFVCASSYESYGIAAAEALAHGLPVVSWARGGSWEFLSASENALRVRPADRVALTRALAKLCADRTLLRRLARGARRTGRALPRWDDAAAQLEKLLQVRAHVAA